MKRAVFVLARHRDGYAGTTRPSGGVGLPGGKVEAGESDLDALRREAMEEGWEISEINPQPILVLRDPEFAPGYEIVWYEAEAAKPLADYKEKHRLRPIMLTAEEVRASGLGNELLPLKRHEQPRIPKGQPGGGRWTRG